jgi:hypothetical protein
MERLNFELVFRGTFETAVRLAYGSSPHEILYAHEDRRLENDRLSHKSVSITGAVMAR